MSLLILFINNPYWKCSLLAIPTPFICDNLDALHIPWLFIGSFWVWGIIIGMGRRVCKTSKVLTCLHRVMAQGEMRESSKRESSMWIQALKGVVKGTKNVLEKLRKTFLWVVGEGLAKKAHSSWDLKASATDKVGVISRLLEEDGGLEVSVAAATEGQEQEGAEGQRPACFLRTWRAKDKSGFVKSHCESTFV